MKPHLTHRWVPCHKTLRKCADIGSQGNDQPFEQAFANLAHAYLRDKAPGLLDYEVGFQLVDRDEDKNAVGLFGFKVGSTWLYAPVFFINGDLKGHELLYNTTQDKFVPLKENWINSILGKKPLTLGEGVSRQTRQLGVRYPDMLRITQSPHKYAGSVAGPPLIAKENPSGHGLSPTISLLITPMEPLRKQSPIGREKFLAPVR